MAKKSSKGGRPYLKISEQDRGEIKRLAGLGLTVEEIATIKGISARTLYNRCAAEMKEGKTSAKALVISRLMQNIKDGKEASIFFYLKTQCGWKETQVIEGDVSINHVISAKPIDDNEWAKKWTGKTIDITEEGDDEQED